MHPIMTRRKAKALVGKFLDVMEQMGFNVYDHGFPALYELLAWRKEDAEIEGDSRDFTEVEILWDAAQETETKAIGRA